MKLKVKAKIITGFLLFFSFLLCLTPYCTAGNKKIMSTMAAKVIAERAIVESIHGLKIRSTEVVENMVAASFEGMTQSKTSARIKGIKFEEIVYDKEKDVAKVTASIKLDSITNIDGNIVDLKNKVFKRVGFATSTSSMAGPLKALRAAEIDAYTRIAKQVVGFELESETTVKDYMLTSDLVKTKVLATLFLAELKDYGWDEEGDAYVHMTLNKREALEMLGGVFSGSEEILEVEGQGALHNDFEDVAAAGDSEGGQEVDE